MKNGFILSTALIGALVPGVAAAQSSGTVTINGTVADRCLFTVPSKIINLGELSLPGTGSTAGKLDAAKVDAATETLSGWCNGVAATMTVDAAPLVNTSHTTAPPSGFDRIVNYTATASAGTIDATDTTATGAGSAVTLGLYTGDIIVNVDGSSTPGSGIMIAGNYQGVITVTLAPNSSFTPPIQ